MPAHATAVYACSGLYTGIQMMPNVVIMTLAARE